MVNLGHLAAGALARAAADEAALTVEQGAQTPVQCATDPDLAAVSGRYYDNDQERAPSPVATPELPRQLWDCSEAWTAS